ncbi:MAG: TraC family protein [Deltaproteobacteria bacterium]|nr:TraC family protein [Deltaproteobacteria bacterium]
MGFFGVGSVLDAEPKDFTKKELNALTYRNQFSKYLPWIAFDRDTGRYCNTDQTTGFIWECSPLSFASNNIALTFEGLFRIGLPDRSVIQFILYADPNIDHLTDSYAGTRGKTDPIIEQSTEAFIRFLKAGTTGLDSLQNIPVRNFRLFVAVKVPFLQDGTTGINLKEVQTHTEEILKGCMLFPRLLEPSGLLSWMRSIFNDGLVSGQYNPGVELRRQMILSESEINIHHADIQIGGKHFRCVTPKVFPNDVSLLKTNQLIGGIWGMSSDMDQITTPFLYSLNVVFRDLKNTLHTKCNFILQQQGVGSFAPSLERKKGEYLWAVDELEKGTKFLRIIPTIWVWGDEKAAIESITRVKRIWESNGFVMQEDRGILPIIFLSSLPFGLYDIDDNIDYIDRDFIAPVDTITSFLPVQADFAGGGKPILFFIGRKGQLCPIDIFDRHANNHNVCVCASSGGGKSFLINNLTYNYYAADSIIRIIDVGFSYKKMATMLKGCFLDFNEHSNISLNPFTHIKEISQELSVLSAIILQMAYSATDWVPKDTAETAMTLIKSAVLWAFSMEGTDSNVDTVYEYLQTFPKYAPSDNFQDGVTHFKELALGLAFNLQGFTSHGQFGRWFNKPSNLDISKDRFVVLELENLKPCKELFRVVTLQVINAVTKDLYLSDRGSKRLIVFDEAWQFLRNGVMLKDVIEEGYRRARKYGGSFTAVTQSILDLKSFGDVGDVIMANSAFKFYMQSDDFEKAKESKLIDYDEFTMKLLKSVKSNRPKYSEIFMDTPFGVGVGRLVVDPFSYYLYTSDSREVAEIEAMVKDGLSYEAAVQKMVKKYRS